MAVGDGCRLRFEVIDTGIGIEAENLSAVFQAFRQTRSGAELGGTGLGLTISHRLVRGMGGELKVESTPGVGSRFYFDLPLRRGRRAAGARGRPSRRESLSSDARLAPGEHLTVLVADDSSVNRRILASLLESAGVRVITAAGGIEAVELARAHRPDVVLMDLRMGDLSGFEATRRIAADAATAAIPVIAVSASAWAEVRQQARDAGCVDFLPKPVKADVLFAKLQRYTGVRFVSPATEPMRRCRRSATSAATSRRAFARRPQSAASRISMRWRAAVGGGRRAGALGRRIAALTAAFDYDALLRLAASLEPAAMTIAMSQSDRRCPDRRDDPGGRRQSRQPAPHRPHARGPGLPHSGSEERPRRARYRPPRPSRPDPARRHDAGDGRFRSVPRAQGGSRDARRDRRVPLRARRGQRQGHRARARRVRLHHQADPAEEVSRGSPTTSRGSSSSARSAAAAIGCRRSWRAPARCSAASCPAALPSGNGADVLRLLPHEPVRRRRLLRRVALPDGQFGVIVADVSGHGAPAAIVMAMIRAAVHAFPGFACDPAEMVRYLNRHFEFLWESPMFATALCALVDPRDRERHDRVRRPSAAACSCAGRVKPFPWRRRCRC